MKTGMFLLITILVLPVSSQCRCTPYMVNLVELRKKNVLVNCKVCCFSLVLQYIYMKVFKNKLKCLLQSYDCSDSEQMGRAEL